MRIPQMIEGPEPAFQVDVSCPYPRSLLAARLLGEPEVEADPIALELERGRRRALRLVGGQVELRRFDARPSRYPGYTSLYDPVEDEWHDFPTKDCYPSIVELANKKRRKGGAA